MESLFPPLCLTWEGPTSTPRPDWANAKAIRITCRRKACIRVFDPSQCWSQATNMKPWTAMNWRELLSYYQLITLEPALRPASGCWCNIPALATAVRLAPAWHQLLSFLAPKHGIRYPTSNSQQKNRKKNTCFHPSYYTYILFWDLGNLWQHEAYVKHFNWFFVRIEKWFAHHFPSRFPTSRPSARRKAASSWSAGTGAFHNEKWPAPSLKDCNFNSWYENSTRKITLKVRSVQFSHINWPRSHPNVSVCEA